MNREKLLRRVSVLGFAMYECRLFCDTHPENTEALALLDSYTKKYNIAKDEFEKQFGPLVTQRYEQ